MRLPRCRLFSQVRTAGRVDSHFVRDIFLDEPKLQSLLTEMIAERVENLGVNRVLEVARTVADLACANEIESIHLQEPSSIERALMRLRLHGDRPQAPR